MKLVIQRVKESSVEIDNKIKAEIGKGLLILIGIKLMRKLILYFLQNCINLI